MGKLKAEWNPGLEYSRVGVLLDKQVLAGLAEHAQDDLESRGVTSAEDCLPIAVGGVMNDLVPLFQPGQESLSSGCQAYLDMFRQKLDQLLGTRAQSVLQPDCQVIYTGSSDAVMLAGVDGRRYVGNLLANGLEGVRRADLKVYAVEGKVFGGRGSRAEGPNAFLWVRASFNYGWRVQPGWAKIPCIACITECFDLVRDCLTMIEVAVPFSTRSRG